MAETHPPYSSFKKLSSFFNGITAVSGVVLIGLGFYVKFRGAALTRVLGLSHAHLHHVGYLCLVLGCVTVLLSFTGWYGVTKENRGTLLFCSLFMIFILIMEIGVTSVVLGFLPTVQDMGLEHNVVTLRTNYKGFNEPDDYSTDWNSVMEKGYFTCESWAQELPWGHVQAREGPTLSPVQGSGHPGRHKTKSVPCAADA
nr:tetraspanin-16 isoform X4 [Equus caballus]